MALTNAERQKKYREKIGTQGNYRRLQLILDHTVDAELDAILFRHKRLNKEADSKDLPATKQDLIASLIHKYALELGLEYDRL